MNKGTSTEIIEEIVKNCHDLGISVSLMCQIGFPGETYEESLQTSDYLRNARREVAFISIVPFVLEHGSEVFKKPESFGTGFITKLGTMICLGCTISQALGDDR